MLRLFSFRSNAWSSESGRAFGPSERATYDLADLDGSYLNIPTGESGQVFSPYFKDQWLHYYEGRSFTFAFREATLERSAQHNLMLLPAR